MTHKPIFTPVDPITKLFTGPGVMDALTFEFAGNDGTPGAPGAPGADAVIPERLSETGLNATIDDKIVAERATTNDTIAAALAGAASPIRSIRKIADTTRTDQSTPTPDPELTMTVKNGGVYHVEGFIIYSTSSIVDIKMGWTGPGSSTMDWNAGGLVNTSSGTSGSVNLACQTIATILPLGGGGAGDTFKLVANPSGIFTAAADGALALGWSQSVTDPSSTVVYSGSMLKLTRLN